MADDQKKIIPINYTNREFQGVRNDLLQIAERFYPDSFQDFSDASFGAMMVDSVAYVADQLNFYLDYNISFGYTEYILNIHLIYTWRILNIYLLYTYNIYWIYT